jgi:hypothetical protein
LLVLLAASLALAAVPLASCRTTEIARNLGLAYAAYTTYVSEPAKAGKLGPNTAPNSAAAQQAADAAKFATLALEAAREEAAPDQEFASFAQKTAAAGASLNAVAKELDAGRPSRGLVAGGLASLESLNAAARDRGLAVSPQTVSPADLSDPPAA